ncbi:MAG: aquaporin family protein [Acidimicrobiia bacterium]|nr:aquaporin family protein [Acidimicrobiia bacterium]
MTDLDQRPGPATPTAAAARADRVLLARRLLAEGLGTAMLVAIVVGSGIYAAELSTDPGPQLLESSIATGAGLMALILAFGPVSGAHFNPVVTLADRMLGGISTRDALAYIAAQILDGCLGTVAANVMFGLDAIELSTHARSSGALWFSEVIATMGLLLVILGVVRSGKAHMAPFAVGAYIAAAYWFTSSTSFANPGTALRFPDRLGRVPGRRDGHGP